MFMNFHEYIKKSPNDKLDIFMNTLSTTNRTPEYYVNWNKVENNTRKYELELNTLNYLLGKEDILEDAKKLFLQQPNLLKAIPSLIASRDKKLNVLILDETNEMDFYDIDFVNINLERIDVYIDFIEKSGLFDFLQSNAQKNLVDFVYGVETGLDSNARKNRSGDVMEDILGKTVKKTCEQLGFKYKLEATADWMYKNWGIEVPVDKSKRRFDAAIFDKTNKKVYVMETNYYGGGGSKLKSVAGEFTTLNRLINKSENDVSFIWVTDGQGWHTARLPISEAFEEIYYIFNLEMLRKEYIHDLIK